MFELFGVRDFLPQNYVVTWLASHLCTKPGLKDVCANIVFVICGYDKAQLNTVCIFILWKVREQKQRNYL